MKKLWFFLLLGGLIFSACEKDGDDITDLELHHDGPNSSAPFFEAGEHEAGARFNANTMRSYDGKTLEAVEFYLVDVPNTCEVRIYGQGTSTEPGALLYSADVSAGVSGNTWNRHTLSQPITLDGSDLWINVMVRNTARATIMGCDPGPADANGDWLFSTDNNAWQTFRDRTNQQVDINWNIRGDVAD